MSQRAKQSLTSFLILSTELRHQILSYAKTDALSEKLKKSHRTKVHDISRIAEECHCPSCISNYRRWMAKFGANLREVDERIIDDVIYLENQWRDVLAGLAKA